MMEVKCGMCEFNGIKPHCYRCKMLMEAGDIEARRAEEINLPLKDLLKKIEDSDNVNEFLFPGDFMFIDTVAGKLRLTVVGLYQEHLENGELAKVTFAISDIPGKWRFDESYREFVQAILPKPLRDKLQPAFATPESAPSRLFLFSGADFQQGVREDSLRNLLGGSYWVSDPTSRQDQASLVTSWGCSSYTKTNYYPVILGCCV